MTEIEAPVDTVVDSPAAVAAPGALPPIACPHWDGEDTCAEVERLTGQRDALVTALSRAREELVRLSDGQECDHGAGVCYCAAVAAMDAADRAIGAATGLEPSALARPEPIELRAVASLFNANLAKREVKLGFTLDLDAALRNRSEIGGLILAEDIVTLRVYSRQFRLLPKMAEAEPEAPPAPEDESQLALPLDGTAPAAADGDQLVAPEDGPASTDEGEAQPDADPGEWVRAALPAAADSGVPVEAA